MISLTGIVLAGGKSARMGTLKAFLNFEGKSMIHYPVSLLREVCREVFIVTQTPDLFSGLGAEVLGDHYLDSGPMSGLFTGLEQAANEWCAVLACDTPFVREELLLGMMRRVGSVTSVEAVVPLALDKNKNKIAPQPLCALYSKNCLPVFHKNLRKGEVSLIKNLAQVETEYIHWLSLDPEDYSGISFTNLNTPLELKEARKNRFKFSVRTQKPQFKRTGFRFSPE